MNDEQIAAIALDAQSKGLTDAVEAMESMRRMRNVALYWLAVAQQENEDLRKMLAEQLKSDAA